MLERFPVARADSDGPVLITGGGCNGSWASALLVRAGVPVVVCDPSDDKRRPRLLMTEAELARLTWVQGDIADAAAVAAAGADHGARGHSLGRPGQLRRCSTCSSLDRGWPGRSPAGGRGAMLSRIAPPRDHCYRSRRMALSELRLRP